MIKKEIGQYNTYAIAMQSGYFVTPGLTPFESVFYWPAKDFVYLMTLKIVAGT